LWFWALICLLAIPAAGLFYQWVGMRRDRQRFPAPGRFVTLASGVRIHLADSGAGECVWLEAGLAASSVGWRRVEKAFLDAGFRVLAMDRAGYGWSEASATPRTMENLLGELREAVLASAIPRPLLMVGHSFGGLLLRHYAARFPEDVAALVLLDPLEPCEYHPVSPANAARIRRGAMLARRGALLARLGVVRLALEALLAGGQAVPKFLARVSSGRGSAVTTRLVGEVRKLPADVWHLVAAHWRQPRGFLTLSEYLGRIPEYCAEPLNPEAVRLIPTGVVSAGTTPEHVVERHRAIAAGSAHGIHIMSATSGHWVHLDQPDLPVKIVTELLHSKAKQER
jgi:pimeloyl-ACP methyl ester carboxylesterase